MSHIFLSYCAEDRERVKPLVALLSEVALVWWDQSIHHGENWEIAVETAVEQAACVVVAWTRESVKSNWVRSEAGDARDRSILVPVLLDDVKPPLAFRHIQTAQLQGWDGDPQHPKAQALKASVERILAGGANPAAALPPKPPEPPLKEGPGRWWRWRRWPWAAAIALLACSVSAGIWWHSRQPSRLYRQGLQAMATLELPSARGYLERALRSGDDLPLERSALAEVLLALGRDDSAIAEAKRAYASRQEIAYDDRLLVEARYQRIAGSSLEAVEKYRRLQKMKPGNVEYALGLADAQAARDDYQGALTTIEAMQKISADPRLDLLEATAANRLGQLPRQLAAASRVVAKAERRGLDLLAAEGLLLRGVARRENGQSQQALDDYLDAGRRSHGENAELAARIEDAIAHVHYAQGNLQEAEKWYGQALRSYHDLGDRDGEADEQLNIASIHAGQGRLRQGGEDYKRAIALSTDRSQKAEMHANLGFVLHLQGDLPGAAASLQEAVRIFEETGARKERASHLCNLARVYADKLELAPAEKAVATCLELSRAVGGDTFADALATQGKLHFFQGDLERAWKAGQGARRIYEKHGADQEKAGSMLDLAEIQLERNRASEARALIEPALKYFSEQQLADDKALAHAALARTYLAQGATTRAQSLIDEAKERAANSEWLELRVEIALAEARVLAAMKGVTEARSIIQHELDDPKTRECPRLRLQARLAQGGVEVIYGDRGRGRELLSRVQEDALVRGYGLVEAKAARLLASP